MKKEIEKKQIEDRDKLFIKQRPQMLKSMKKNDYVLKRVQEKFHQKRVNTQSVGYIVSKFLQMEKEKYARKSEREEKEFIKNNFLLLEKLDLNKRFFEPILEEKDLEQMK